MANEAHEHQRIMAAAGTSLVNNRAGGRRSIGQRSADMKRRHLGKKLARMAMAVGVVLVADHAG